jgi:prephenate dehydrogenase
MRVGIVGYGAVSKYLAEVFIDVASDKAICDKYVAPYNSEERKERVNGSDIVFIAVPTPSR